MNGISADTIALLTVGLSLAGLILQQLWSLRAEMKDLRAEVKDLRVEGRSERQALDARLRIVQQTLAQHGLLLQALAKRELGMDADLSKPAIAETTSA